MKTTDTRYIFNYQASLTYSKSKAKDTYGYTVVTLNSTRGQFRSIGVGYDMVGEVFSEWIKTFLSQADLRRAKEFGCQGVTHHGNRYYLDVGCGLNSMIEVLVWLGYQVDTLYNYNKDGKAEHIIGFIVKC